MPTAASAPTVTPGGVQWTLEAYLKQPRIVSRDLTSIVSQNFVADRVFQRGSPEDVAGGYAIYQKSEPLYLDSTRDLEEVGPRAVFPRAFWTEDLNTAQVHQYGIEVPLSYLTFRRSNRDMMPRLLYKVGNSIVKFFDGKLFTLLNAEVTAGNIQTTTATASWTGGSQKILADFAKAARLIYQADLGYVMDTVLLSAVDYATLLTDAGILAVLGREGADNQASAGEVSKILGIRQIIESNRLAQGTAWFMQAKVVGTIADEAPAPQEGFTTFDPGADMATMWVRTYDDVSNSQWVVRAMRSPAMWVAEPKAAVKMTGL